MRVWVDGSSRGNPGISGIGIVINFDNGHTEALSKVIGDNKTNNEAEYEALIEALKWLIEINVYKEDCTIYTDSKLVFGQVIAGWKINHSHLMLLNGKVKALLNSVNFKVDLEYTPRKNQIANELAQEVTLQAKMGV